MNKVCFGCGSILQFDNPNNPGYIPENKYNDSSFCKRCFRLTHYGEINNNELEKSTKSILDKINKDNIFKIYIVDFLNINDETINIFKKIKGNKMILISKLDLMSKSLNKDKIVKRLKEIYSITSDIKFISALNNYGINSLLNYLKSLHINKCYLLGPTNSGKSTLINKLMELNNSKLNKLTTSNKRNTTLEFIRIKLNDNLTIIDSPGFIINEYGINSKFKNSIKQYTFNMKSNEILNIDKFFIKFSEQTSITIYINEQLKIKKYYKEIDNQFELNIDDNTDICINGLGILNIKKSNKLIISGLDSSLLSVRKSIFGDYNE